MQFRTAHDNNIQHLYHYQSDEVQYLTRMLHEKTIYMSSPKDFNDPWDCRIHISYPDITNKTEIKQFIEYFKKNCQKLGSKLPEHIPEEIEGKPEIVHPLVDQISIQQTAHALEEYRIYCMSPICNSILMWSHYAKNHKGICLEAVSKVSQCK